MLNKSDIIKKFRTVTMFLIVNIYIPSYVYDLSPHKISPG
jgi:hypothetical protein